MAPPPPPLMEELIAEILVRLPPSEPACLFRASAVSRSWIQLVSNQEVLCRHREHHAVPPLLGFFQNKDDSTDPKPRFVPTCRRSPPFAQPDFGCKHWMALDCRHGRVLVHTLDPLSLRVWNPINGDQEEVPVPTEAEPALEYNHFAGAVLCAADGCDHLNCAGGPFRVVFVPTAGGDVDEVATWVRVYSSETRAWTDPTTIHPGALMDALDVMGPILHLGDCLYFTLDLLDRRVVLKYHMGNDTLTTLDGPQNGGRGVFLVAADNGGLGFATVEDYNLHMWSKQDGDGWARTQSIDLGPIIPLAVGNAEIRVVGYAEGVRIAFVSTNDGVSMVNLKSGEVKKVSKSSWRCLNHVFPYATFYTHALGRGFNG